MENSVQLSLYEYSSCPFCARVRRFLDDLGESVESRDITAERSRLEELVNATGRQMVPCLRIEKSDGEDVWMPESADIIDYLREHFAKA
ncbi:MAG: glutaredoxin 2 [Myxococcota bacterium]|jgi:glutaredoxin 2